MSCRWDRALAGSNYPVDRRYTASLLEFPSVTQNSLDAVSDRDAVVEVLSAFSVIMMHLSRLSEELISGRRRSFGMWICRIRSAPGQHDAAKEES